MEDFRPSIDFVARAMDDVRSYEKEMSNKKERLNAFLLSKSGRIVLLAAGILLGILNILGMVSLLTSPAACF